jgi:beige protein homolog 1
MNNSLAQRYRSVSASTATPTAGINSEEIESLVIILRDINGETFPALQDKLQDSLVLQRLRHLLIDDDSQREAKDAFRRAWGFQALLSFLHVLSVLYNPSKLSQDEKRAFFPILRDALAVLGAGLQDHPGNQKYFSKKVGSNGWHSLSQSLDTLHRTLRGAVGETGETGQYLGILLATALGEEALSDLFTVLQKQFADQTAYDESSSENYMNNNGKDTISKYLRGIETTGLPDLFKLMLDFWSQCQLGKSPQQALLGLALPITIKQVMSLSRRHLVAMHTVGLSQSLLPYMFDRTRGDSERDAYQDLALCLFHEGVSNLEDAYAIYSKAASSPEAAQFLLKALKVSRAPPSIHFDLSNYGYCSVELSTLGKTFPPMGSSGYTFAVWVLFEEFDPNAHTTIFGAFDATQKCFVLAYLEKDTKHFILQTAIKGSRPSVRFKSFTFKRGQWYHICIVHRKPRTTSSSRASLFVNGEFCEQLKASYPSVPPVDSLSRIPKVQAFFGTPQDLAVRIAKSACSSKWSLASSVLFEDTFSDDLIAVFYQLGPRYNGNFQDCLGSFQTYAASAALNVRHENLHPGDGEHSDILSAVRQKASTLIAESAILINISPSAVLDSDDRNYIDESQLVRSLSRLAAKNLQQYTRFGGNAVVINAAVPAINDALTQPHGVAVLAGEPVVAVPQSLDDASWRIGGCAAVGLTLVHSAKSTEDVTLTVEILFETIRQSWRNSEAMERDQGYAILATLIRDKLGYTNSGPSIGSMRSVMAIPTPSMDRNELAMALLRLILDFVGYDFKNTEHSIINNPLAYRVLLVDTDVWRQAERPVQELYFQQFITFAADSQNHRFNARRLGRMRALKKMLDALKAEPILPMTMPLFLNAFKSLLPSALNTEMLRSIALFITFSVHKGKAVNGLTPRRGNRLDTRPRRNTTQSGSPEPPITSLSRFQIGVEVLRLYSDFLCAKEDTSMIKKFARTVTNKWLLYLLSETSPEVVILSAKILARLLVVHGSSYVKKFKQKTGGFIIMRHRLKRWWHLPALWPICFAVLFDVDIGVLDLDRAFDLFGLLDLFGRKSFKIANPEMLEVVMGMLQSGLKTIVNSKPGPDAAPSTPDSGRSSPANRQRLSMSNMTPPDAFVAIVADHHIETLHVAVRFLADLHGRSKDFRDFAISSSYVQDLFTVLFPVVVGSDNVSADVELNARESTLTFDGNEVVIRPLSTAPQILKTSENEIEQGPRKRGPNLRRGSSFVIVPSVSTKHQPSSSRLHPHDVRPVVVAKNPQLNDGNDVVQSLLEIVIAVFTDQILTRKDFAGLGLFLKTPAGFIEHQTYFESWILRNTLSQLNNSILLNQKVLCEPKVLSNLARLFLHIGEALYEGWFIGGVDVALDFAGSVLEYLQRSDIAKTKSVRLCSQAIAVIRASMFRTVLLNLSHVQDSESLPFLTKLGYWQTVLLSGEETHADYLQLICYLLYACLISPQEPVRMATADLWRIILVQKPNEASAILKQAMSSEQRRLASGFEKLVELDNETFLYWVDSHRDELDSLFFNTLAVSWDKFVAEENAKTEETGKQRVAKRREKLKLWAKDESSNEDIIRRHEVTFDHWTSNIYASEQLKHQRSIQDQQDNTIFTVARFEQMKRLVELPIGFMPAGKSTKWRLDQTEGRNRMRLRITPEPDEAHEVYQPKRKTSNIPTLKVETVVPQISNAEAVGVTPGGATPISISPRRVESPSEPFPDLPANAETDTDVEKPDLEESFELVEDPKDESDGYEDKNRKVMRSLHRGDQVQHVANISRIIGLEAAEGLLILGKDSLYLLDNFFQRADGEIVNVWQAPHEERDSYVRMISGREAVERKPAAGNDEHETRSWKWADVISVSKRRFLFRDVALELFFADGRSYLLTTISPAARNDLFGLINAKAPQHNSGSTSMRSEDTWRFESLRSPDDEPQSLGSKFANVFGQAATNPATRRWIKGEISNFHYLMLINTMAGRTFNDLTQYPVFPWILADYTSEELDLTNPKTFRDLSKPMGCQTQEREAEYKERYATFAEMSDHNSPAFHYGTHYSSAMIVTSYLIRLQPFVKSYLLLQGGSFDHADRMFYSVEKAWNSASRINMTDVRELTPEFFYLPEFLLNINDYDFGARQNTSQSISSVELPPWAKGDPKIFIAKHREALESPHVSRNLHKWIDLVFGYKQKGDAALEAVNVFHHLSYQGAKDLDAITDPVERLATIGIIHNFGQTPYQVFQKAHPAREEIRHKYKRLDTAAESLTRLPFPLLNSEERVASLSFSWKQDRLLCSAAFRLNIPPTYERYMEWGFADGSIRFYSAESRKLLGHFEHLHIGQLSAAIFADSRTLVTSGVDCTVSVWNLLPSGKNVDLQPKSSLFGHRTAVNVLALSRSFSALLSASIDGTVILWDLNRLEFVRVLTRGTPVECARINDVNGNIVLCHGSRIVMYTLNGKMLLDQAVGNSPDDLVLSCAFYEGAGNEWLEREIFLTGHKRGVVKIWNKVIRAGRFELELIRQLNHVDNARDDGINVRAGISYILPMPQVVYTGDEDGRVVSRRTSILEDCFMANYDSMNGTAFTGSDMEVLGLALLDVGGVKALGHHT